MKVVLTRDVEGLGRRMEVREVADGYARNYLFPRRLAIPATRGAQEDVLRALKERERQEQRAREQQEALAARIAALTVTIPARAGADGRLYGSVTAQRVAEALKEQHDISIDRRKIRLRETIKDLGSYQAQVSLGQGVGATLRVEVVQE